MPACRYSAGFSQLCVIGLCSGLHRSAAWRFLSFSLSLSLSFFPLLTAAHDKLKLAKVS